MKLKVTNKADKTAEIFLYSDIGLYFDGVNAKMFSDALKEVGDVSEINVRLNSSGGDATEGIAIYNALVRHPARIIVDIDGLAASAAATVAMAGDEIRIAENAMMMIHDPMTWTSGGSAGLRKAADMLDKHKETIVGVYSKRTGKTMEEVSEMMTKETWFNADEAIESGFATSITENKSVVANVAKDWIKNAPTELLNQVEETTSVKPATGNLELCRQRFDLIKNQSV